MDNGWIGVDFDGTLAFYERFDGSIGLPVPVMAEKVKRFIDEGIEVRIVTARAHAWETAPATVFVFPEGTVMNPAKLELYERDVKPIEDWTELHLGKRLQVTCMKDYKMFVLYDDRAVSVQQNTGLALCWRTEP